MKNHPTRDRRLDARSKHCPDGTLPLSHRAFSLIELLITIAVIGVVSAIAMPAYTTYVQTANMSKVNAAYENAIRVIRSEFQKAETRVSMGLPSTFPAHKKEWPDILNPDNSIEAPGGGPMYSHLGKKKVDWDGTGAIRIAMPKSAEYVRVFRPAYLELKPLRAQVYPDRVDVKEL